MAWAEYATSMDPLRVAFRTYTLSLSLSLFPAVLPVLASPNARSPARIREILKRECSPTGFAFAMTLATAGGRALDQLWNSLNSARMDNVKSQSRHGWHYMSASQRTFLANTLSSSIGVMLLTHQRRRRHIPIASIPLTIPAPPPRGSPTLDLTLLLLVRAVDAQIQIYFRRHATGKFEGHSSTSESSKERRQVVREVSSKLDAFVFWLACSRFSFFRATLTYSHSHVI